MKIILIGFMGSGKSTIARLLGKRLNLPILDTDNLVEKKAGIITPEIFEKYGEMRYRELEIEVAKDLRGLTNGVIATGGGIILNKIILEYLQSNGGTVVFLRTQFNEVVKRVSNNSRTRPLFQNKDKARKLFDFRLPMYEFYANVIIDTDHRSIEDIVKKIIESATLTS